MLNQLREKIKTAQDKDIEDKEGSQPKRYYAKDADGDEMSKSTKDDRAAHFAKNSKKDDDDASAYKPAPGDKTAKTKPSQYTKQYKKMFGEDAVSDLKAKHADDMEKLKARHERELEALKSRQDRQSDTAKASVDAEKEREKQRKEVQLEANEKVLKKLKKIKGLTKDQLRVLSTIPSPMLTTVVNQLSTLVMSEEVQEGKLVADVDAILNAMVSEFKKQFGSLYRKNNEKGLAMLNRLGSMIGAKASSKMQQKGKLFLKMELGPDADAGDYVKDFRKSDAPQFKGKSDKKIRQMAIAAYLDKKDGK